MWGYLKEKVYTPLPTSMAQLKQRITAEMALIPSETVREAMFSTKKRAKKLLQCEGEAFEGRNYSAGVKL